MIKYNVTKVVVVNGFGWYNLVPRLSSLVEGRPWYELVT
jgi:hypothetical protein